MEEIKESYESKLELLSLRFLNIVGDINHRTEALEISKKLLDEIVRNKKHLFEARNTGNYGMALHSILYNQLTSDANKVVVLYMYSYWALSNHLQNQNHHLIRLNRALLMDRGKSIFAQLYKQAITTSNSYNVHSIDYAVAMNSIDITIEQAILNDLSLCRQSSEIADSVYNAYVSKGKELKPGYSSNYYDSIHKELVEYIHKS